jgi:tetratricopeptide (TPR) repeat protein
MRAVMCCWVAGVLIAAMAPWGCVTSPTQPTATTAPTPPLVPVPTTAPATRPADPETPPPPKPEPSPEPLPAKATVAFADLQPAIEKPSPSFRTFEVPARVKADLAAAEQMIVKRNYSGAVERLDRASGFAPENPRIRRALGVAYGGLGNVARARENLLRSAKSAPDDMEVQFLLGRFAEASRDYAAAIVSYRTAMKCSDAKPSNPVAAETLLRLGDVLRQQGYWTAALESYEQLGSWIALHGRNYMPRTVPRELVLRPERMLLRRGQALASLRRAPEARDAFAKAYRRNRANAPIAKLYLQSIVAVKDYPAGEKVLLELAAEPSLRGNLPELALLLCMGAGDPKMPGRIWKAYRKGRSPEDTLAVALAQAALKLEAPAEATAVLESLLATKPGSIAAGRLLVGLLAKKGEAERALRLLAQIVAADLGQIRAVRETIDEVRKAGLEEDFERGFAARVRADGDHALLYIVGELAQLRGKKVLAADQYRRAIEAKEDFLPAYDALMTLHLAEKDYVKAEAMADRVGKLAESEPAIEYFVRYLQGRLSLARGDTAAAEASLQLANAARADHLPTLRLLASVYQKTGKLPESATTLLKALDLARSDEDLYRRLFDVYIQLGRTKEAGDLTKALLARSPESLRGGLMEAEILQKTGKSAEATKRIAELSKKHPRNVDVRLLSYRLTYGSEAAAMSAEKLKQAVAELKEIAALDPSNTRVDWMLAELLSRNKRHADAARIWGKLYEDQSRPLDVGNRYVASLIAAKQYEEALDVLEEFRAGGAKAEWLRDATLEVLEKLGRLDELEKLASRWIQDTPDEQRKAMFRAKLVDLYREGKHYDKAHKVLDEWVAATRSAAIVSSLRGQKLMLYGEQKKYDEAVRFGRRWIMAETLQTDIAPKRLLLYMLSEAKQYDKLQELLSEWIEAGEKIKDPAVAQNISQFRYYRISYYGEAGKLDEAESLAKEYIRAAPDDVWPREGLFVALVEAKKYKDASRVAEAWLAERMKALSAKPATQPADAKKDAIARWSRQAVVRSLVSQRKYAEGAKRATALLKDDPLDAELLNLHASCLGETGRKKEAMAALEKAIEQIAKDAQTPGTPEEKTRWLFTESLLKNNLAYMYAEAGVKLDRAERLIREAMTVRPGEVSFQDTFAWVFYKQGRIQEAARVFELVFQQGEAEETDHAVIHDHAGDAYYRAGKPDEAVKRWTHAAELARKEELATSETKAVLKAAPAKVKAVQAGKTPAVAPLGAGVKDELKSK